MNPILRKLASRKFLVALGVLVLETIGVDISPEVLAVLGAYVLGESVVDAAGAKRPNVSVANPIGNPQIVRTSSSPEPAPSDIPAPDWDTPSG